MNCKTEWRPFALIAAVRRTFVFVTLVVVMATIVGLLYGAFF
jgi:hypothetical protein